MTNANTVSYNSVITPQVALRLEQFDHLMESSEQEHIMKHEACDIHQVYTLGTGAFCNVSFVISKSVNKGLAMKRLCQKKILSSAKCFLEAATDLIMEAHFLSKLDHPHIIKLRGVSALSFSASFQEITDGYFLTMDIMAEILKDRLQRWRQDPSCYQRRRGIRSRLTGKGKKLDLYRMHCRLNTVAVGIANAMDYIHKRKIILRDLKPANIGFQETTDEVCLFDFGFAREISTCNNDIICGTPRYMAPEAMRGKGYSFKSDVYSFGVLLHEIASLRHLKRRKKESIFKCHPFLNDISCHDIATLIKECLSYDPEDRPSFDTILITLRTMIVTSKILKKETSGECTMSRPLANASEITQ